MKLYLLIIFKWGREESWTTKLCSIAKTILDEEVHKNTPSLLHCSEYLQLEYVTAVPPFPAFESSQKLSSRVKKGKAGTAVALLKSMLPRPKLAADLCWHQPVYTTLTSMLIFYNKMYYAYLNIILYICGIINIQYITKTNVGESVMQTVT